MRLRRGAREHHAFQQRVAGQAVGAVQAGAGGLADGVQARHVGAARQVGEHAAAGVVRRRHHRDRLARDVDAQLQAARVGCWGSARAGRPAALVRDVEVHAVQPVLLHLEVDGARHHVARRQLGARVVRRHEAASPSGSLQQAAFAAHRLADQEGLGVRVVQAGRVELDELHVRHPAARAPGHGDAVAGGGVGVGGVEVDLAGAAGGQDGVRRAEGQHLVGGLVERVQAQAGRVLSGPACVPVIRSTSVCCSNSVMLGVRRTVSISVRCTAAPVASVTCTMRRWLWPPSRVRCSSPFFQREGHAQLAQPGDGLGRVLDHEAGGRQVAQAGAGDQRVVDMRLRGCRPRPAPRRSRPAPSRWRRRPARAW